jgi:hypothetical protein
MAVEPSHECDASEIRMMVSPYLSWLKFGVSRPEGGFALSAPLSRQLFVTHSGGKRTSGWNAEMTLLTHSDIELAFRNG